MFIIIFKLNASAQAKYKLNSKQGYSFSGLVLILVLHWSHSFDLFQCEISTGTVFCSVVLLYPFNIHDKWKLEYNLPEWIIAL